MKTPSTTAEWKEVAADFDTIWQFPHCLGAIDGKHCGIQCFRTTGSQYLNYKKFFSFYWLYAMLTTTSYMLMGSTVVWTKLLRKWTASTSRREAEGFRVVRLIKHAQYFQCLSDVCDKVYTLLTTIKTCLEVVCWILKSECTNLLCSRLTLLRKWF